MTATSKRNLLISFSGGETSAFMTKWLLDNRREEYGEIVVLFANTGEEDERTLEFVRDCDKHFGFGTVWIEAVQRHNQKRSAGYRVVDFDTASRQGEPFEDSIRKYGIPNSKFKDCTRNLKRNPIEAYVRDLGWKPRSYDVAIGIRIDEVDRMRDEPGRVLIYPLIRPAPMTKPQINSWWRGQPFRLDLKGYQGNCRWCWKKSMRKHITIARENPSAFDFPARMEAEYGRCGPEFRKIDPATPIPDDYRRTFFRGNLSTADILRIAAERTDVLPADDENQVFDEGLDIGAGCEESCEVY